MSNVKHGNRQDSGAPFAENRNIPTDVSIVAAAGGSNVSEVTITVLDGAGNAVDEAMLLQVWLSDAATGAGLTGTTASGTVTAKSASGAVFATNSAKKSLLVQTLATGVFVLEITDSAKTGFYVCVQNPATGEVHVGTQLTAASYG